MAVDNHLYCPPVLDHEEARKWDKLPIEKKGIESRLLMGWAGYSIFLDLCTNDSFKRSKNIHLLAGPGNNGGDGFVVLWHILSAFSKNAIIWLHKSPATEDAIYFYNLCISLKSIKNIEIRQFDELSIGVLKKNDVVIDALFGTGINKILPKFIQTILTQINEVSFIHKIAVDIPTGVYANGDFFSQTVFKADTTYTFGGYKIGHLTEPGILYSGKVIVQPIGLYPIA